LQFVKTVEKDFFSSLPNTIFNTVISPEEFLIIQKIQSKSTPLQALATIKRGMEIGKNDIRENKKGLPTLLGEDVNPYGIEYQKTYCNPKHKEVLRLESLSTMPKVLVRRVANTLLATYDDQNYYFIKNLYGIISNQIHLKALTGLLNSRLLRFFLKKYFTTKKEDIFPEIQVYQLEQLPIKVLNLNEKQEKQTYEQLIMLVEKLLDLQQKIAAARVPQDKTLLNRVLEATEKQLDNLVYQIYQLTSAEIAIIEKNITS
jgi:hypothetical protein